MLVYFFQVSFKKKKKKVCLANFVIMIHFYFFSVFFSHLATLSCDETHNCTSLVQEEGEGHLVMATLSCDQTPNCVSTCAGGQESPDNGHVVL